MSPSGAGRGRLIDSSQWLVQGHQKNNLKSRGVVRPGTLKRAYIVLCFRLLDIPDGHSLMARLGELSTEM